MPRYVLAVHTRPVAGLEADYHRWYDQVHLAEVLGVPGFVGAQRLAACEPGRHNEFVATYTIESDDIDATIAEFDRARALLRTPPSLDPESVSFRLYQVIGGQ